MFIPRISNSGYCMDVSSGFLLTLSCKIGYRSDGELASSYPAFVSVHIITVILFHL